eukprot:15449133-Alexandrium_andersonii.AAC.1
MCFAHSGFCLASLAVGVLSPLPWAPSAQGLCKDSMRAGWGFNRGAMGTEQGLTGGPIRAYPDSFRTRCRIQ